MEKINRELIEDPEEDTDNALIGEIVASLNSEAKRKAYTMGFRISEMFMFMRMLHSLTQDYIKSKDLKPGDPEYTKIVENLAELSGVTNCDYCLNTDEMQYCIENSIIPVNLDAEYIDDIDSSEPLHFIKKSRFDDVVWLASVILSDYETPREPGKPEQTNQDGSSNLLLCTWLHCEAMYEQRKEFAVKRKADQDRNINIENNTNNGRLDFDL